MPAFLFNAQIVRALIFTAAAILIGYAYYMQLVLGLEPCPLCITQRFFLTLTGLTALVALLHNPTYFGGRIYAGIGIAFSAIGGSVSSRQLYLQSLPEDQVPACGPSLDYILEAFPITEAISILFQGTGDCAKTVWTFLGISIPGWMLFAFLCIIIGWLFSIAKQTKST